MKRPTDLSPTIECIEISKINFTGNVIPNSWYENIKFEERSEDERKKFRDGKYKARNNHEPKTDLAAVNILAEIVFWYRVREIAEESTGKNIRFERRFWGDQLQRQYDKLGEKFGLTKEQTRRACANLQRLGLIELNFRNLTTSDGLKLVNVMFIRPIPDAIKKITYLDIGIKFKSDTYKKQIMPEQDLNHDVSGFKSSEPHYSTKITSENTSKIEKNIVEFYNSTSHESENEIPQLSNGSTNGTQSTENGNGHTCKTNQEKVEWVINMLNAIAGTNYKASTNNTQRIILARIKEGFNAADFLTVIKFKCQEWKNQKNDIDMTPYIRPMTLFGNKFEGYLNVAKIKSPEYRYEQLNGIGQNTNGNVQNISYGTDDLTEDESY